MEIKISKTVVDFPGTRFMGSKNKVIDFIWDNLKDLEFTSVLDAFSGSGIVSYMFKTKGKVVHSNDYLTFSHLISKATTENNHTLVTDADVNILLDPSNKVTDKFVSTTFKDIYFTKKDNLFIDTLRNNIYKIDNTHKQAIIWASLARACLKKRPRGVFTYTGNRYNDGRKDLNLNLESHFIENIKLFNHAIFDNKKKNYSYNDDVFNLKTKKKPDLVYFDPPYLSKSSDNDYVRRYHFVEGMVKNWKGLEIQENTVTKKFKSYNSRFRYKKTIHEAFEDLFKQYSGSIIALSYSSNAIPSKQELIDLMKKYKTNVNVYEKDHTYSFGTHNHLKDNNTNRVKEYLFVGK